MSHDVPSSSPREPIPAQDIFRWQTLNFEPILREEWPTWREDLITVATEHAEPRWLTGDHPTVRESRPNNGLPILTVPGEAVENLLPQAVSLYEGRIREEAERFARQPVVTGRHKKHRLAINVQRHNDTHPEGGRYEGHVDTNPIEALLFATSHYRIHSDPSKQRGGILWVNNTPDIVTVDDMQVTSRDIAGIEPREGYLALFDATRHSHYVDQLTHPDTIRVVLAMNYYTESMPEQNRDAALDRYLGNRATHQA